MLNFSGAGNADMIGGHASILLLISGKRGTLPSSCFTNKFKPPFVPFLVSVLPRWHGPIARSGLATPHDSNYTSFYKNVP